MMRKIFLVLIILVSVNAISQESTYILVRHAEKDTTQTGSAMMQANPPLTEQGLKRAEKLVSVLQDFTIDSIYSTNFSRTISTASPSAIKLGLEVNIYDHKKLADFSNQLLQGNGKTFLVIGHSNTTPSLANLLLKEKKYLPLDESIYNKIFIVTIKNGEANSKIIEY